MQVKHSQRLSQKCLMPWVIVEMKGTILAAHCTCMAGYVNIIVSVLIEDVL